MSLGIIWTAQFKRDYKKAMKRGLPITRLDDTIRSLAKGEALELSLHDHDLKGNWLGYRECYLAPDWLLIYKIEAQTISLVLTRTGSHSDLFS